MTNRFDNFTARALRVFSFASGEALERRCIRIGPEHILLGIVSEHNGIAAKVLANLNVKPDELRSMINELIEDGDMPFMGEIMLAQQSMRIIELAVNEARLLGQNYIGTEHLLLGLVREGESVAAGVLRTLGVNLERVRAETIHVIEQESDDQVGFVNDFLAIEEADRQQRILEDFVSLRPSELTDEQVEEFEPTIRMWAMSLDQRKNAKSGGYTPPEA